MHKLLIVFAIVLVFAAPIAHAEETESTKWIGQTDVPPYTPHLGQEGAAEPALPTDEASKRPSMLVQELRRDGTISHGNPFLEPPMRYNHIQRLRGVINKTE